MITAIFNFLMWSPIMIDRSIDAEVYNQPVLIGRVILVYHVMMVISSEQF